MAAGKHPMSSSSSSFATDLFGSNDTSSPSAVFGSIFSPSTSKKQATQGGSFTSIFDSGKERVQQQQHQQKHQQQPCHLSSSIYYGGQDVYSYPPLTHKKDGDEDDTHSASRGNWWQGSLYY